MELEKEGDRNGSQSSTVQIGIDQRDMRIRGAIE